MAKRRKRVPVIQPKAARKSRARTRGGKSRGGSRADNGRRGAR